MNELDRVRLRALDFVIEKNDVITAAWESEAELDSFLRIERILCARVNAFMDDAFPGWRDPEIVRKWYEAHARATAKCNCGDTPPGGVWPQGQQPPYGCPVHGIKR